MVWIVISSYLMLLASYGAILHLFAKLMSMFYKRKERPVKTKLVCPGGNTFTDVDMFFGVCFNCKTSQSCKNEMRKEYIRDKEKKTKP